MGWRRAYRSITQFLTISPCQLSRKADRRPEWRIFPSQKKTPNKQNRKTLVKSDVNLHLFLDLCAVQVEFYLINIIQDLITAPFERAARQFSRVSNYQQHSCNIWYGFALSFKPVVLWSEWLCWSWDQTSAKLCGPRLLLWAHVPPAHSDLGPADIAASLQPDVIKF